jgi:adenylate cyclase
MTAWMFLAGLSLVLAAALVVVLRARSRERQALQGALERRSAELEHLERAFSRFAPDEVVERLSQGVTQIEPERREVTVMFADLVGFTRMSEQVDPAIMVPVLNEYFARMSRVIRDHHGRVSRIMGDGIMALFGALDANTWQASDADRAALHMREELERFNEDLAARDFPRLEVGIGLHHGPVVAAVVGSDEMMEFTVMGDAVNVAARVEALTRTHGVDILVTEAVRAKLDPRFAVRAMAPATVKGKSEPIITFAVDGVAD